MRRFKNEIVKGDNCFICGATKDTVEFNDEHILPQWLLRRYGLFNQRIGLPNQTNIKYSQYVVPCCVSCNSLSGKIIEEPVRDVLLGGYKSVVEHLKRNGPNLLFVWLSLLFIKTHLKDGRLRLNRDNRSTDLRTIGELYEHEPFHHIHCVARSFYTGAVLGPGVVGSVLALPAQELPSSAESFDFGDLYNSKTILVRVGDTCLVAALDDACAANSLFRSTAEHLTGALNPPQLREVLANISCIAANLKQRPLFSSSFDGERYSIESHHEDKVELEDPLEIPYGEFLFSSLYSMRGMFSDPDPTLKALREGRYSFLFNETGAFITNAVLPKAEASTKK